MSTEAQKRFAVVGAHRQLHADAAKQVARLERLINEAADPDQIVFQARELATSHAAIEIFEKHMDRNHAPAQSADTPEQQQANEQSASPVPVKMPEPTEKNRKAIAEHIKKLSEARGTVPLAVPRSQKSHAANAARRGEKRNRGNTDKKQEDLYGDE